MSHKQKAPAQSDSCLGRISAESADTVRKRGRAFRLRREIEAMDFVRLHTTIPVPAILSVHVDESADDENWIIMKRVPGEELQSAWPEMKEQARAATIRELKTYMDQLRQLRPDGAGWIGSCSGGPAYDHRLDNRATCGPFTSIKEFNDYLVAPVKQCPRPEWVKKYRDQLSDKHDIHYAHADISGQNILVNPETGKVNAILDWEMAGFWPAWWEYRKAMFGSRCRLWWLELTREIMPQYTQETEVDMELEMF